VSLVLQGSACRVMLFVQCVVASRACLTPYSLCHVVVTSAQLGQVVAFYTELIDSLVDLPN
jgi:hypothetical protein